MKPNYLLIILAHNVAAVVISGMPSPNDVTRWGISNLVERCGSTDVLIFITFFMEISEYVEGVKI